MRYIGLAAFIAAVIGMVVMGSTDAWADGKGKKKGNCILVYGVERDSRVTLEYQDERGGWHNAASKVIGKKDPIPWEYCGLKPGVRYRVIARKQGDANGDNWTEFVFQPDPKTGVMEIYIVIKLPPQQPPRR